MTVERVDGVGLSILLAVVSQSDLVGSVQEGCQRQWALVSVDRREEVAHTEIGSIGIIGSRARCVDLCDHVCMDQTGTKQGST